MEDKLTLNVLNDGLSTIEIRHGEALELKEPKILAIEGNIDSPRRVLKIRGANLNQQTCNILVDRNPGKRFMKLTIDESNHYGGSITGKIIMHPDYVEFGINTGKKNTLRELSDFIKMHRYCFEDKSVAMKLVTELRNFKAKVNKDMEKNQDQRGNNKILYEQTVDSNIPESFTLNIPIFKAAEPVKFQVDINIIARETDMDCSLESVEANDIINDHCDKTIDKELVLIKALTPDIVQVEL
jgi:hypothetical protein